MRKNRKRAYVIPRYDSKFIYYSVRAGRTDRAPLIKEFYGQRDAERFRDMLNGKIPKDEWFKDQF